MLAELTLFSAWMAATASSSNATTPIILPNDTRLEIRLTTPVSSRKNHVGDTVAAVLLQPVTVNGQAVVAAGAELQGVVLESGHGRVARRGNRARLLIEFSELRDGTGRATPLAARVVEVDNARETVDEEGRILSASTADLRPRKLDAALLAAAPFFPATVLGLEGGRFLERELRPPKVRFASGTEMTLRLTRPVAMVTSDALRAELPLELTSDSMLTALVAEQPFFASKPSAGKASDPVNLVFIGDASAIDGAFRTAGWTRAASKGVTSMAKGLFALAARHGYKSAPLSALEVDGRRADVGYEKQCNTVAKRHHVRLWRRPERFLGEDVWIGAATHDVALTFAALRCTVFHHIAAGIDAERDKIVGDLLFTRRVAQYAAVARPGAPTRGHNAYNDPFETDGRVAVVFLEPPALTRSAATTAR